MIPGTPGAVTADIPDVTQHIDAEVYTVTVGFAQPDVLVGLARALRRRGLMRTFAGLGVTEGRLGRQLAALLSEPSVRDALTVTLSPDAAEDFGRAVDDATLQPAVCEDCRYYYAVARGLCPACTPEGDR
jgi:hypothetical protein